MLTFACCLGLVLSIKDREEWNGRHVGKKKAGAT